MKVELNESVQLVTLKLSEAGGAGANVVAVWCRTGTEEGISMDGLSEIGSTTGVVRGIGAYCVVCEISGGSTFCGLDVE